MDTACFKHFGGDSTQARCFTVLQPLHSSMDFRAARFTAGLILIISQTFRKILPGNWRMIQFSNCSKCFFHLLALASLSLTRLLSVLRTGETFRGQAALRDLKFAKASFAWPLASSVSLCSAFFSAQSCLSCLADLLYRFVTIYRFL